MASGSGGAREPAQAHRRSRHHGRAAQRGGRQDPVGKVLLQGDAPDGRQQVRGQGDGEVVRRQHPGDVGSDATCGTKSSRRTSPNCSGSSTA
ncbi:MAG: hypothetical protein UHS51_00935, partial [Atopobiaceae bacterium]|nr:hypothetical protein [Atopobiaceae bacterium]